jgi:hypothetical protein
MIGKNIIPRRWQTIGRYFITTDGRHPQFQRKEVDKREIYIHS